AQAGSRGNLRPVHRLLGGEEQVVPGRPWTDALLLSGGRERASGMAAPRSEGREARHPFPRLRWAALLWLSLWVPAYASVWGLSNFLHLCDVAVILTCAGLWSGSALLLSSQAVSSILID